MPTIDTIILDGKSLARRIEKAIKTESEVFSAEFGRQPVLATLQVGSDPESAGYVRTKLKRAESCGFATVHRQLPNEISQAALELEIDSLNSTLEVDGILLQLPLPSGLSPQPLLERIALNKDVDGLNPENQRRYLSSGDGPYPCTPLGCYELIVQAATKLWGTSELSSRTATVIGRSELVGRPMAALLESKGCEVCVAHRSTQDLSSVTRRAEILVVAAGSPGLVTGEMLRKNAIVIDVGITYLDRGLLSGDVVFASALGQAGAISPVPGGVGPMTVCMLMANLLKLAKSNQRVRK